MASSIGAFSFLIVILMIVFAKSENCDKQGVLLYEDIGCTPINEGEKCPSRYDCNLNRLQSGCAFKGKHYGLGEDIPSDLTYSGCSIGCRCEDPNVFRCAVLCCPESFGSLSFIDPSCYLEYQLGECCTTGQICNATSDAKKCQVDGKTYQLGQQFHPKNTCFTCVCHENFTGEYDKETCIRQNCLSQIHFTEKIFKKCAPAYFNFHSGQVLCCPDEFVCPDSSDNIKLVNRDVDQNSTLECEYGSQKLKLGEGFTRKMTSYGKDRDFKCECIMPPLVTCKEA